MYYIVVGYDGVIPASINQKGVTIRERLFVTPRICSMEGQ